MSIKFLTDEHIDPPVSKALREAGINILSVKDVGLLGASDEDILEFAVKNNRIVVTMDKDFLIFHSKNKEHKGIIYITKQMKVGNIMKELENIELTYNPEDLAGIVMYIPQKG